MNFVGKLRVVVLGGLLGLSSLANATVIEFSEDYSFDRRSFEFSDIDGTDVNLEVTTGTFSKNNLDEEIDYDDRVIDLDEDGFGVSYTDAVDSNDEIDGQGGNDLLVFTFDTLVTILSVTFEAVDPTGDDFAFGQVIDDVFVRYSDKEDVADTVDLTTLFSLDELTGTSFGFGAIESNDDFRIVGIEFEVVDVPAPATSTILALGLALIGFGVRRKQQAR